ncbi:MAG TPA: universal stress protein [Anaerolineales bacterium]|nr:universal stress protein [Anaerolineales bacterium]
MNRNSPDYHLALQDFQSLYRRAQLQGMWARLTGKSNELLSYEEIASKLRLQGRSDKGIQTIPVDAIVGSVGRYTDFTRTFLPRRAQDQERWANVKAATLEPAGGGLEVIEVYKVSEVYFVMDGNHRVSIAHQEGWKSIEAHVIEIQTDIPLTPDIQPDELIIKAEYARFLEQTGLSKTQEYLDLRITIPGGYQKLLDEVGVCCIEAGQEEFSLQDSAARWYREIYLPFDEAVRERNMMRWFPERTVTDLYIWMSEHRGELEKELGWNIRPEAAAEDILQRKNRRASGAETEVGSWRKARLINRYSEHLFRDILVPVGDNPQSWEALEQAIHIAGKENANIHGLHTVSKKEYFDEAKIALLQRRFQQVCEQANVRGILAIEIGEPTGKILERAALTDLIVMKIAHPPSTGIKVIASNIRTLIMRSSRPVLAIPGSVSKLEHALLAFDGSPKSKEALFVATYLAEQWKTKLSILTAPENRVADHSAKTFARNYLEFNEIEAEFITKNYSVETLKSTAEEIAADLIVMGSYGGWLLKHVTVGSSINFMLRESQLPLLICR